MKAIAQSKAIWGLVAILALTGCGRRSGIEKVVVQGVVQFDGKPLPNGQIMFYPIDKTRGPVSIALIQDGNYVAESKGGVPVGHHQIRIEGYRRPSPVPGMDIEDLGREQYLPAKFNAQSELTTELTGDDSPAIRDFTLTK